MVNWINKLLEEKYKKSFRPKKHKPLMPWLYEVFVKKGDGLYYSNIKASGGFIADVIAVISGWFNKKEQEDIPLSHSVIILYSENLESCFTPDQWNIIKQKWDYFYGNSYPLDSTVKLLTLASADETGMDFFDFSHYEFRDFSLRKANVSLSKQNIVTDFLVSIAGDCYDYTGLAFWWLYKICSFFKFLNDRDSYYCSENVYEAFKKAGFYCAPKNNPSPLDIENYHLDLRFFVTPRFLK